jgi:hypothetical protein
MAAGTNQRPEGGGEFQACPPNSLCMAIACHLESKSLILLPLSLAKPVQLLRDVLGEKIPC